MHAMHCMVSLHGICCCERISSHRMGICMSVDSWPPRHQIGSPNTHRRARPPPLPDPATSSSLYLSARQFLLNTSLRTQATVFRVPLDRNLWA